MNSCPLAVDEAGVRGPEVVEQTMRKREILPARAHMDKRQRRIDPRFTDVNIDLEFASDVRYGRNIYHPYFDDHFQRFSLLSRYRRNLDLVIAAQQ